MADSTEQRRTLGDAGQVDEICSEVETAIVALRARYEQYFLGVDRKPPNQEHAALKKRVSGLRNTFVRQVATKFRVEAVTSKLLTYERLWARTLQEIEAGTYRRDLFKLKLRSEKKPQPEAEKLQKPAELKPVAPAPVPVAAGLPKTAPLPPREGQLSDQKVKAIYDAYLTAKRQCNEDVSKLSLDALSAALRKQVPSLLKAHNAKSVEFKVVIKDGKAVLRALPRNS